MKRLFFYSFLCVGLSALLSSCAYQVFPISTLEFNYDMNMQTAEELNAKSNVHIFLSDKDVPADYEVLSYVRHRVLLSIPIIAPERRQRLKKYYKKAVLKAESLGGNGVIVVTISDFKVIDIPSLKAVTPTQSSKINPILMSAALSKFDDGSILSLDNRQTKKYVTLLKDEIESNLKACKTLEEANYIERKIDALNDYYKEVGKSSFVSEKQIQAYRVSLNRVKKKIKAKESRTGKKASNLANLAGDLIDRAKSRIVMERIGNDASNDSLNVAIGQSSKEVIKKEDPELQQDDMKQMSREDQKPQQKEEDYKEKPSRLTKDDNIYSTTLLDIFEDGSIGSYSKKEVNKIVQSFTKEIESNIKRGRTIEDFDFILRKVSALEKYNEGLSYQYLSDKIHFLNNKIQFALKRLK